MWAGCLDRGHASDHAGRVKGSKPRVQRSMAFIGEEEDE